MGLEFFTGFEGVATTAEAVTLFTVVPGGEHAYSATGGYDDGKCFSIWSSYPGEYGSAQKNYESARKTAVVGFHVRNHNICTYSEYMDGRHWYTVKFIGPSLYLISDTSGLHLYRGSTLVASSAPNIWINPQLHHIEIKVFSSATAGTFEVKMDGLLVWSETGINTGGQDIIGVRFGNTKRDDAGYASYGDGNRGKVYYDNIFLADDWQGELNSFLLLPESDYSVQWSPSTGSDNYAMIDEVGSDGDTTYVETTTAGHKDLYEFEDLPATVTTINAVSVVLTAKKIEPSGLTQVQTIAEQDAVEYEVGDAHTLSTEYPTTYNDASYRVFSTCPDGTAWTPAKLNAIKWGIKAVA